MALNLRPLTGRPPDWDAIVGGFPGKTVFHESCWLDHIADVVRAGAIHYCALEDHSQRVGYVPLVRTRRMFLSLCGSPLPGTGTNYLGPLVSSPDNLPDAVEALQRYCQDAGIHHLELAHPWLHNFSPDRLHLDVHRSVTHIVPLAASDEEAWKNLKGSCRNRVRKAEANGLTAELTTDPSIVDHFIAQYREVYGKQGLGLPFGPERPRSLFNRLVPAQRVLCVWVQRGGDVLAAGLFPHDESTVYFWGAASWLRYQHMCPNELLHWHVIRLAIARGIKSYDMCGGTSQFKDKFGGSDVPHNRYSWSFLPGLRAARALYMRMHMLRLRLHGVLRQRSGDRSSTPA